jgi:hypothetical protein
LERAKRRSVNGVEDDGYAGLAGSQPTQDSGLSRVRVDDVG